MATLGLPLTISFEQQKIMRWEQVTGLLCAANATGRVLKDALTREVSRTTVPTGLSKSYWS